MTRQCPTTERTIGLPLRTKGMPNCKSCGIELSEAAAGASIFALSFLPIGGQKIRRELAISIAEKVGPLCLRCLSDCKELPAGDADRA